MEQSGAHATSDHAYSDTGVESEMKKGRVGESFSPDILTMMEHGRVGIRPGARKKIITGAAAVLVIHFCKGRERDRGISEADGEWDEMPV